MFWVAARTDALSGAAPAQPFVELFTDLRARHLGVEFLIEPGGQAASLGPPAASKGSRLGSP